MSFPFVFEAFFVICVIAVENISYLMADVRYVPLYEKSAPEFQVRYRCYYVDMFFCFRIRACVSAVYVYCSVSTHVWRHIKAHRVREFPCRGF